MCAWCEVLSSLSLGLSIDDAGLLTDNTAAIETTLCVSSWLRSTFDASLQATANVLEQTLVEASSVAAAAERVREVSKERCRG